MKYCPITYQPINVHERYSHQGLQLLSPKLKNLEPLALNAKEQRLEAVTRRTKMALQGVQLKLSANLIVKENCFKIVDQQGHYILKPQSEYYPELPENEAITMTLAAAIDIEVPVHGLVYSKDGSMTYFIKRFDRAGHRKKIAMEDFTQLLKFTREIKYNSSMEQIIKLITNFCTFPKIEFVKLFKLTLFNFLIGNEDMHLKNYSLINKEGKTKLSPAYDLLNTTIAQSNTKEEIALPINGKKNNLRKNDLLKYFACEQLQLNSTIIANIIQEIKEALPKWKTLIQHSYLSANMRKKYLDLLEERYKRIF